MVTKAPEKIEIEERLSEVASLNAQQKTLREIAELVGVSHVQVKRDLDLLRKRYQQEQRVATKVDIQLQSIKIDAAERQYWIGWERSLKEKVSTRTRQTTGGDSEKPTQQNVAEIRKEVPVGDPRFLDGVLKCIERRCRLLGLDAPERHEFFIQGVAERIANELGCTAQDILRDAQEIANERWNLMQEEEMAGQG